MKKHIFLAVIEIGFIMFLFYANLLMGEFERSGVAAHRGLTWAVADICTVENFTIGIVAAVIGYLGIEFLRKKL